MCNLLIINFCIAKEYCLFYFMNYDKIIDRLFFKDNKLNLSIKTKYNRLKKRKYVNIKNYLCNRYSDSCSERETLYRLHYYIDQVPKCPVCGKSLKFSGRNNVLYLSHCSNKCKKLDLQVNEKWKLSCGETGTNREKAKHTILEKYGYENPYQIPEIIEKIRTINKEKKSEVQEKIKQTCIKRYGVDHYTKTKEYREKVRNTSLAKYGTEHPIQSNKVKAKYNWKDITNKISQTKNKNKTYNVSKTEDITYILLVDKFKTVLRQYRSDKYPFNCDFYIPSIDTYIECQYGWMHGEHPYDKNNENDIYKLQIWKDRGSEYYLIAIEVWTKKDPLKRQIAKDNNLNYIEFWNLDEVKLWIDNYEL